MLCISLTAKGQHSELSWNEFYKLGWEDFRGVPDMSSNGDAATAVAIKAKPFLIKKRVEYDVIAIFNRDKSWVRDKSQSLLAHEQLHFDIAEWYARKIRRKVQELKKAGINEVSVYNAAIQELLQESNEVDRMYDLETLHGALSKKQAVWEEKIKSGLSELSDYQKKRRVITGS